MPADPRNSRPVKAALCWMLFLGPFFFLVYGLCNFFASRQVGVPSYYSSWERQIPFVPALIVPYFSIDLFFAASVFICRDRRELDTHVYQIILAILISALGFLLFPLRFAFPRPAVDGVYGFLFDVLGSFDKPFNQAPSLHLSLLLILWTRYARHVSSFWRWLLHGWFSLIGVSVLFVYQHHFIDIWTGLVVGVICLYALPDGPRQWPSCAVAQDPQRWRVGLRYFVGSLLCFITALTMGSWMWLLAWPGVSLLLVASAYFALGPAVFQKVDGQQSWPARILLAPYLLGAWVSYRLFTRSAAALHEAAPGICFGRLPRAGDLDGFKPRAVLDLTAEFCAGRQALSGAYLNLPILDLTVPDPAAIDTAVKFIAEQLHSGPVYVHCALGYSRSATVVAAWLVRSMKFTAGEDALKFLVELRPGVTWTVAHVSAVEAALMPRHAC